MTAKQVRCPVCRCEAHFHGSMGDGFYGVTDHIAQLFQCSDCRCFFQWPIPDRRMIASFYPDGYWQEKADASLLARLQAFYIKSMLKMDLMSWVKRLRPHKGDSYLDVGCSRGDWLALIKEMGLQVTGIEADSRAAAYARETFDIPIIEADGDTWEPDPESYHLISFFHLLEHLREPSEFLGKVHRALKPGGRLLLRVPNAASFQVRILGSSWKGWEMPRHIVMFTPRSLEHLLGEYGFRVLKCSTWALRDGPPSFSSSVLPSGEPTWQQVKGKPSGLKTLLYLALTWLFTPLEWLVAVLGKGSMITIIAEKKAKD